MFVRLAISLTLAAIPVSTAQVNEPKLLLLRHSDLQGLGDGTTACVADTKAVPQIPQRPTDIPGFWTSNTLLCVFFVHADNRWYVSYGFAEGPEPANHSLQPTSGTGRNQLIERW